MRPQVVCQVMAHLYEAKPVAFVSKISAEIFEEFHCHLLINVTLNILLYVLFYYSTIWKKFPQFSVISTVQSIKNIFITLVCRIDVHAHLLILRKNFPLHGLIWVCMSIVFEKKFPLHGLIWPCTFIVFEKKIPLHVYFSALIRVFALHVY